MGDRQADSPLKKMGVWSVHWRDQGRVRASTALLYTSWSLPGACGFDLSILQRGRGAGGGKRALLVLPSQFWTVLLSCGWPGVVGVEDVGV